MAHFWLPQARCDILLNPFSELWVRPSEEIIQEVNDQMVTPPPLSCIQNKPRQFTMKNVSMVDSN